MHYTYLKKSEHQHINQETPTLMWKPINLGKPWDKATDFFHYLITGLKQVPI
jgi:hypothetical protein